MARRSLIVLVASTLLLMSAWAVAQTDTVRRPALGHEIAVLSGENIGVRLTGSVDQQGRIPGTVVAKVNGKWVDVVAAPVDPGK